MKERSGIGCLISGAILLCCLLRTAPSVAGPAHPFPQHLPYQAALSVTCRTRAQVDADIRSYYDRWKRDYVVPVDTSGQLYRISAGKNQRQRTVSEGQGYGMLLMVHMAGYDRQARHIFDGLWRFARRHPSRVDGRLMAWEVPENPATGVDAAFDGDADMAQALLMADRQWGSAGSINYRAAARTLLAGITQSMIGPRSHLVMLGDWVEREGPPYSQYTVRTSDFMVDHFRTWYALTGDVLWLRVIGQVQQVITQVQRDHSPQTGLLPDFLVPESPGTTPLRPAWPNFLEGPDDGHYEYNAGRDPWRLGTDALLYGDAISKVQAGRMAAWMARATGGDARRIKDGYFLDGRPLRPDDDFTIFFAAPFGVAAMTRPELQHFLNSVYLAVRNRHEDYYEDTVTLLCLLVMGHNYWNPDLMPGSHRSRVVTPWLHLLLGASSR